MQADVVDTLARLALHRLLAMEKRRRGLPTTQLVFVGAANVAEFWWCAEQSVLKSRDREAGFFQAYLQDRLLRAIQQRIALSVPKKSTDILQLAASDAILAPPIPKGLPRDSSRTDEVSRRMTLELYRATAAELPADDGFGRGQLAQGMLARPYRSVRWNWRWRDLVVVGVPDGITRGLVYEFKSCGKAFFLPFIRPVALTQADLYGYFWNRPRKHVEFVDSHSGERIEVIRDTVDCGRAQETLRDFREVARGRLPPAPKTWKCTNCEYRATDCRIMAPTIGDVSPRAKSRSNSS